MTRPHTDDVSSANSSSAPGMIHSNRFGNVSAGARLLMSCIFSLSTLSITTEAVSLLSVSTAAPDWTRKTKTGSRCVPASNPAMLRR